jgi:hypothetical protein
MVWGGLLGGGHGIPGDIDEPTTVFPVWTGLGLILVAWVIADPQEFGHHRTLTIVQVSWVSAVSAILSVLGWRAATLITRDDMVSVRTMFKTWSVPWSQIDGFVAETRSELLFWPLLPPFRARRSVLCVRLRDGETRWLSELSCRPARAGATWVDDSVTRLNELLAMHAAR